jgi:acyl transferase domain-containing protein
MHLPLNTCHTHIDLVSLTNAILAELGIEGAASSETRAYRRFSAQQEEVVVVGQSVRLPGDIRDPCSFWEALIEQRDDIMTPVPPSRWDHASFYRAPNSSDPPSPCDISLDKAGWIDLASFDHSFFGLGSSEAFFVSPTIRLTLEMAFEALENGNIPLSKIKGSDMGVFVANAMDDGYIQLLFADKGWGGELLPFPFFESVLAHIIHSQPIHVIGRLVLLPVRPADD